MKTNITYLYLKKIFITSINILQTIIYFQFNFYINTFNHFNHYIFHQSYKKIHKKIKINTQLSTITFSIQLKFYL